MKKGLIALLVVCWLALCRQTDAATVTLTTTWSAGQVLTASALNTNLTDITSQVNNNLDEANLGPTIALADSDFFNLSAINASSNTEGLRLPQAASTSSQTTEGLLAWDTDNDALCVGDSAANRCLDFSGDFILSQATPQLIWRDSTDDVAYTFHLDTATGQQPWDFFTLWRGTSTGLGNFTVGTGINAGKPLMQFNSSNDLRLVDSTSLRVDELTNGGVLFGGGDAGAITASAVMTNGQLLIGDGTTAPTLATLTAGQDITVTNGSGSITVALEAAGADDQVLISDNASGGTWRSVPDCAGSSSALRYTAGTNSVSCGTITGFSALNTRSTHNAAQSISTSTLTALAFNTEDFDTDTMHDPTTNNSRITFTTAGKYLITCHFQWAANVTGYRGLEFRLNGATIIKRSYQDAGDDTSTEPTSHGDLYYNFAAADYVECMAWQTSGVALNVLSQASGPAFTAVRIQ